MNNAWARYRNQGFTIVELLIVIVVIAILAAISVVAYTGIQKRAAETTVVSDLRQATQLLSTIETLGESLPDNITDIMKASPNVQLTLLTSSGGTYYSGLTSPQNGLLFRNHCVDLVNEGYGNGPSDFGGGTVAYISSCTVFNVSYIQINGWNGGFNVSNPTVTIERLQNYIESGASANPDHPSYRATLENFMDELISRFTSQGGTFPITSFWNDWEPEPSLPEPTSEPSSEQRFCIQATHASYPDISYVSGSSQLSPRKGTVCS